MLHRGKDGNKSVSHPGLALHGEHELHFIQVKLDFSPLMLGINRGLVAKVDRAMTEIIIPKRTLSLVANP